MAWRKNCSGISSSSSRAPEQSYPERGMGGESHRWRRALCFSLARHKNCSGMGKNLIFDLGFFNGDDAESYLNKGYKVVSVEGDPVSVQKGRERFKEQIAEGKLVLINKAISDKKGTIEFFTSEAQPHRGSCFKSLAEYDGFESKKILVETISINDLCDEFGTPLFMKIDIDGCEIPAAEQIFRLKEKPQYLSTEIPKQHYAGILSWLWVSGYRKFQFRNQANNLTSQSGLFGDELPQDKWISFEDVLARYMKFRELRDVDYENLSIGWLDLHASL